MKLGKLIQKQHAIVGETDFPRSRLAGSAEQSSVRNRVMRTPKRPVRDKPVLTVQQPTYAVDLGRLDSFAHSQRRQNRWDPLRNHRFPRAWRSDAKQIMAPRSSNFDRSFLLQLDGDLREV